MSATRCFSHVIPPEAAAAPYRPSRVFCVCGAAAAKKKRFLLLLVIILIVVSLPAAALSHFHGWLHFPHPSASVRFGLVQSWGFESERNERTSERTNEGGHPPAYNHTVITFGLDNNNNNNSVALGLSHEKGEKSRAALSRSSP